MFASVASKKKNKMRDLGPGRFYKNVFESVHSPTDLRIYLGKLSFYARLRHWETEIIETTSRTPRN